MAFGNQKSISISPRTASDKLCPSPHRIHGGVDHNGMWSKLLWNRLLGVHQDDVQCKQKLLEDTSKRIEYNVEYGNIIVISFHTFEFFTLLGCCRNTI